MICISPAIGGRLNAFQKVMLQWSGLHPYNATHVYKLAGPLRLGALRAALEDTYWQNGLGMVELDADGAGFRYLAGEVPEIRVLPAPLDGDHRLAPLVAEELNQRFERPRCHPLRFAALDAGRGFHYLLVTYDHWIADSTAARLVLRHVLGRYCRLSIPENDRPLDLYSPTYRQAFAKLGGLGWARAALRSCGQWLRHRDACQPAYACAAQMQVNYDLYPTPPGTVAGLKHFARSLGATVHDVILAALGRAMAEVMPRRGGHGNRRLALGTIVDTRADVQQDIRNTLGAFFGYYRVQCPADEALDLAEMTRRIAALTGPIKAGHRYLDSVVNMRVLGAIWPWLKEAARPNFARRALPFSAAVSNVYLHDTWVDRAGRGQVLEYFRGASTGPMLPLILSPTTLGDQMNVAVTYRTTAFSRSRIEQIMASILDQLKRPAQRAAGPRRLPPAAAPAALPAAA
jgi:hypothetical protein